MIGVTQFVRGRRHIAERLGKIHEHARLIAPNRHAPGSADLAGSRIDIDPALGEGAASEIAHAGRERIEVFDHEFLRLVVIPRPAGFADWREEIPPGKRFRTHEPRLGLEVAPENREGITSGAQHRVERFEINGIGEGRAFDCGTPMTTRT